ncbi:MAG: winged helix-turn-helix domain-containing protein [Desulfurococcaceae archaeon]
MTKTLQARILEILQSNPGSTLRDISQVLEIDVNKLRQIIYRLKTQGYVEKIGNTYIVTNKAIRYLKYIEKRTQSEYNVAEVSPKATSMEEDVKARDEKPDVKQKILQCTDIQEAIDNIVIKLKELESKVSGLENQLREREKAVTTSLRRKERYYVLESPVMSYNEALGKYGSLVDKLINENKLIRIGSLVVDSSFYFGFKNKFPLKLVDIDNLTTYEKQLLEEMRKEALVVFHAGREFRLVG